MALRLLRCGDFIFFTAVFLQFSNQAPLSGLKYLARFGYLDPQSLNPKSSSYISEDLLEKAVEKFQGFAGMQVTGVLDKATLAMMERPRCGVADIPRDEYKWTIKNLTYKISNYSRSQSTNNVDEEVQKAFDIWSGVTPLTFTKMTSGPVNIDVRFEHGEHGDDYPFDGPGGVFGHAYLSSYRNSSKVHFDDSEKWAVNDSYSDINLFQAAVHEFGHSLGLSHSDNRAAVMSPFYKGCETSYGLNEDDVKAVQSKYGKDVAPVSIVPSTRSACKGESSAEDDVNDQGDDELCSENGVDTIFNTADGITYVFKGSKYWRFANPTMAAGYPKLISEGWPGLPGNIDAAFTYKNGKTYFFKGSQYWRYKGSNMDGNFPKNIRKGFAGVPDNIDAATVWGSKGNIYFFKGSQYWCYDPTQKPHVKTNYPMAISIWKGIPNDLNAVFQYGNGHTIFFKKDEYYRYNDQSLLVDVVDPPYPRPAGYWWFDCIETNK